MPSLIAIFSWLRPAAHLARRVAATARRIPVIDDFSSRLQNEFLSKVIVRRVTNPRDPDLDAAMRLYEARISDSFRFQPSDIVRWLDDDLRKRSKDSTLPHDYFFVARYEKKVRAFVLFHYYPAKRILFLAYMVVDRNVKGLPVDALSKALISKIAQMLKHDRSIRECRTLLFEVEDPRKSVKPKRLEAMARISRFCTLAASERFSLVTLDFEYLQPHVTLPLNGIGPEKPLLLLTARARDREDQKDLRSEILDLLAFVYEDLYPEGFSDISEEQMAYVEYCRGVHMKVVGSMPPKPELINPAHITVRSAARQAARRQ